MTLADAQQAVNTLRAIDLRALWPGVDEAAEQELKFADCLPLGMARKILAERFRDLDGITSVELHTAVGDEGIGTLYAGGRKWLKASTFSEPLGKCDRDTVARLGSPA